MAAVACSLKVMLTPSSRRASLERYEIDLDQQYDDILGRYPRKPWSRFITSGAWKSTLATAPS